MSKSFRDNTSRGVRGLGVLLRTAHITAMGVYAGGLYFSVAAALLDPWKIATMASGMGLLTLEMGHSRHWVYQGRGVMALAHIAAFSIMLTSRLPLPGLLFGAILIGSIGSHMPGSFRKWSFRHGRLLDE